MQTTFIAFDSAILGVIGLAQSYGLQPTQSVVVRAGQSREAALSAANAAAAKAFPPSRLDSHIAEGHDRLQRFSAAGDCAGAAIEADQLATLYRAKDAMRRERYYQ